MRSSKRSGCIRWQMSVASEDSNWKIPSVRPRDSRSYGAGSSSGIDSMSIRSPPASAMDATASSMTVSVLRPRKSIFSRPTFSTLVMSHCVVSSPLSERYRGT
jgi:hypothetical protein